MRVLITGGGGFIGRNLIEQLDDKYELFAPSRTELDILERTKVIEYVKQHRIDAILHCAAVGVSRDDAATFERNIEMFENIATCSHFVRKIILFGSGAEYDKRQPIIRIAEETIVHTEPADDYGRSKRLIDQRSSALPNVITLRLFGVFGKYEDVTRRFISMAILANLRHEPIIIRKNVRFSYLYVKDLAAIVNHLLSSPSARGAYNIVPDETVDLLTIAQIINELADHPSAIEVLNSGMGNEYTGNNDRLRAEMPDASFTPLREAVRELMNWYRENLP